MRLRLFVTSTVAVVLLAAALQAQPRETGEPPVAPPAAPSEVEPEGDGEVAVEKEVQLALEAERSAFEGRDCAATLEHYADRRPLFVVTGRTIASRHELGELCAGVIGRPHAGRTVEEEVVHVVGPDAAYSVTTFAAELPAGDGSTRTVPQVVTRVWVREGGAWRIVHAHESVDRSPER